MIFVGSFGSGKSLSSADTISCVVLESVLLSSGRAVTVMSTTPEAVGVPRRSLSSCSMPGMEWLRVTVKSGVCPDMLNASSKEISIAVPWVAFSVFHVFRLTTCGVDVFELSSSSTEVSELLFSEVLWGSSESPEFVSVPSLFSELEFSSMDSSPVFSSGNSAVVPLFTSRMVREPVVDWQYSHP